MGLLYNYLKYSTRFISHLYFNNVRVIGTDNIPTDKPVMLLSNHPNSFLDAVMIGASIQRETFFLARGDVFKPGLINTVLRSVNMLPLFRLSEGKENIGKNFETFDACQDILEKRKMVLIFHEGLSMNNWDLRPLRKGPPRVAFKAWRSQTPANELVVIPVGITYEHFKGSNNTLLIHYGKPLYKQDFGDISNEGLFFKTFNEKMEKIFPQLAYINKEMQEDKPEHHWFAHHFRKRVSKHAHIEAMVEPVDGMGSKKIAIPTEMNLWTLLFWPLKKLGYWIPLKIVKDKMFHDAIRFCFFALLWPFYLFLVGIILHTIF